MGKAAGKKGSAKGAAKPRGGRASGAARERGAGLPGFLWRVAGAGAWWSAGSRERIERTVGVGLIVAMVISWFVWRGWLIDRVRDGRDQTIASVDIAWPQLPADQGGGTWLPDVERNALAARVFSVVTPDPFDQASLEAARVSLERTGWFAKVTRVERRADSSIGVEGEWRVPAALVMSGGDKYLVGMDGAPIERAVGSTFGEGGYMIMDPRAGFPGFGRVWEDPAVAHAIKVLAWIDGSPDRGRYGEQVRGVDLSQFASKGIVLVTDTGSRVVWGSPIGEEVAVTEPRAEQKLGNLAQLVERYGRIDAGHRSLDLSRSQIVIPRSEE